MVPASTLPTRGNSYMGEYSMANRSAAGKGSAQFFNHGVSVGVAAHRRGARGEAAGVDVVGDDHGVAVSRYVKPDGPGEIFYVRPEGGQEYGGWCSDSHG